MTWGQMVQQQCQTQNSQEVKNTLEFLIFFLKIIRISFRGLSDMDANSMQLKHILRLGLSY